MAHDDSQRSPVVGASVTRLEDVPLVLGRGLFAADVSFPDSFTCASCARRSRTDGSSRSTRPRRAAAPGVVAVWTIDDIADLPPIDFRDDRVEPLVPYRQPLLARDARALCRRAGRGRVRGRSLSGRGRRRAGHARDRGACRRCCRPTTRRANSTRALDRADDHREGLRRHRGRVSRRPCDRRARPVDRPPFRRAAGDARRDRALRRRARHPRAARRRQGAASQPRADRQDPVAAARLRASVRGPCRRRLRRARRALSRGRAGLPGARCGCGRPVKWIEDRHEHFVATNHSRQQRHQCARRSTPTAASSASRTSSSTTRAPMCAPTARAWSISPPACCPVPTACRAIARPGTIG